MKYLKSIDYNILLKTFFDTYGTQTVWYISFVIILIFSLILVYLYIRHKGWITTPQARTYSAINSNLKDVKEMLIKSCELTDIIIRNQKSKLTHEQVNQMIDNQLYIFKNRFIDSIMETYTRNHIRDNKTKTIKKLQSTFELIIREEDDRFLLMPNVEGSLIPTDMKIKSFLKENIYDDIYNTMINHIDQQDIDGHNEVHRYCTTIINNFISNTWKTR